MQDGRSVRTEREAEEKINSVGASAVTSSQKKKTSERGRGRNLSCAVSRYEQYMNVYMDTDPSSRQHLHRTHCTIAHHHSFPPIHIYTVTSTRHQSNDNTWTTSLFIFRSTAITEGHALLKTRCNIQAHNRLKRAPIYYAGASGESLVLGHRL